MFLLLRVAFTERDEVVNVSAIETARPYVRETNGKACTTLVWCNDDRYIRGSQFSTQRETTYEIAFDDFIAKIAEANQMYWCA